MDRVYTTRRTSIVYAIAELLKTIDGTGEFLSNLNRNVFPKLQFWDEIPEMPAVSINAGTEYREYQGGGYKDRYLTVTLRVYVEEEDAAIALDKLIEDIETVLEENSQLQYLDKRGNPCRIHQISITQIVTDEGALEPIGFGEISLLVQY